MRYAHAVDEVRAAEAALMARVPEGALMQRAAAGLAAACLRLLSEARGKVVGSTVVLLVGSGDNGGDALFAGARMARRGAAVRAILLNPDRAHQAGLAALLAAGGRADPARAAAVADGEGEGHAGEAGVSADALRLVERADLVLDGIVGIGGHGGLRPDAAALARAAARSGAPVVAVDLPSGIDADTGEVTGEAVRAVLTVTFGTHKPGLLVDPGAARAGVVQRVDIGLTGDLGAPAAEALQHADVAALLPRPEGESDKYRRGVVGVAAGSDRYPGAALLAVGSALHGGAGAVRYAGTAAHEVVRAHPETLVTSGGPAAAGRVQAWVVGPGLSQGPDAERALDEALAAGVPVLVDADALHLLARRGAAPAHAVLTPHAGEASALLAGVGADVARQQIEAERLRWARELARRYGCTVLLKGSTTVVASADPEAPVRVNPTGTAWLATAGSGDVLSGLTGALLAAGLSPFDAASVGAYLHGLAGAASAHGAPTTATAVAAALPGVWRDVAAAATQR